MTVHNTPWSEKSVAFLSDEAVLKLCEIQMDATQGRRLSHLSQQQRERSLTHEEHHELLTLMQTYNHLWVRQSQALAEAVRRGLREPLAP
jgi:pyruvate-formate lyase